VLLETLGPEKYIPTTLLLLAEKGSQANEKNKTAITGFAADLVNSFAIAARLTAISSFLSLILSIPRTPDEESNLPIDVKTLSKETLAALRLASLAMVAQVVESRSLQAGVSRAFAAGDATFVEFDYFSPIVEKLLLLTAKKRKDTAKLAHAAMDGVFSVLPIQMVTTIVETFIKSNKDVKVTTNMITIASDRLAKTSTSDGSTKSALSLLLTLLKDVVESGDVESSVTALGCVGRLSRVHGKSDLTVFESMVQSVVSHGVNSGDVIVQDAAVECLLAML